MRLEKIMYEKVFNSRLLGRAREIGKPSHVPFENNFILGGLPDLGLKRLLMPIKNWFLRREWWWLQEMTHEMGLAVEDVTLFKGWELRRDVLTEHVFRESLHPMQRELIRLRHLRHYKVEQAVKGFTATDYMREDARKRTLIQSFSNIMTYRHFFLQNYENDQTAHSTCFHYSRNILEAVYLVGLFDKNAWNRYFFNEKPVYSVDDYVDERRQEKRLRLGDPKDFDEFVARCEAANEKYPGMYAPVGEKVNREDLKKAIDEIIAQTGWKDVTTDELDTFGLIARSRKTAFVQPSFEGEEATGKNNVGLDIPAYLKKEKGNGLFN